MSANGEGLVKDWKRDAEDQMPKFDLGEKNEFFLITNVKGKEGGKQTKSYYPWCFPRRCNLHLFGSHTRQQRKRNLGWAKEQKWGSLKVGHKVEVAIWGSRLGGRHEYSGEKRATIGRNEGE